MKSKKTHAVLDVESRKKKANTIIRILEDYKDLKKSKILDIGTGSGIQAIAAAKNKRVKKVLAIDIQKEIIEQCKKNIKSKKISFVTSDLFQIFKKNEKFDTIIFNPPYLPSEIKVKDLTIEGGKKGYEVLERFLNQVNNYLKINGIVLIVFSSLTKKEKIDEIVKNNLLEFEELEKKHIFFEDLHIYKIMKTALLNELERKKISNVRYFAKGHRGIIFKGVYKNKDIIIKHKNPKSQAVGRISNEVKWLKILNKKKIGPKLLFSGKNFLVYNFVGGVFIFDYLNESFH